MRPLKMQPLKMRPLKSAHIPHLYSICCFLSCFISQLLITEVIAVPIDPYFELNTAYEGARVESPSEGVFWIPIAVKYGAYPRFH